MWNKLEEIPILKKGGIHIKKKNRGKFTDYCGGKVTEECIRKGKNSSNPAIRKRATFAANARKWKHENGGILKAQEGTGNLFSIKPGSPLEQAWQAANEKLKYPGVKQIVGPDGNKVVIRSEEPLKPVYISEYLPGTGDVAEVGYIVDDVKNGNYSTAMLATGLTFLPGNWRKLPKGLYNKKIVDPAVTINLTSNGNPIIYRQVGVNTTLKEIPSLYARRILNGGGKRTGIPEKFSEVVQNIEPKTFVSIDAKTGNRARMQHAMYWKKHNRTDEFFFPESKNWPSDEISFFDENTTLGETTSNPVNVFTGERLNESAFITDPNKKLSKEQMSILRDHETAHLIDRRTNRTMNDVDFVNGDEYLTSPTEVHARITQAKDAAGIIDGLKTFTGNEYKKMFEKYLLKGNPDNQMSNLYYNVTDWNKLAKWANTFVPGMGTMVILKNTNNERK